MRLTNMRSPKDPEKFKQDKDGKFLSTQLEY